MSASQRIGRHARANVVAYLALFIALGGTSAYAANTIGSADIIDNSILSQDIRNGEVKSSDLATDSVGSTKILDDTILGRDIRNHTLTGADIAPGAVGTDALATAPAVSVLGTHVETASNGTPKVLPADTEVFDTANLHSAAANSESLVAPVTGTYVISATVEWEPNGNGYRETAIVPPGGGHLALDIAQPLPSSTFTVQNVSGIDRLSAGQSVHVEAAQGSGGDLGVRLDRFQMTFVGR